MEFPFIFLNMHGNKNLFHKYDGHFNEHAHQIIAEKMFEKLSKSFNPKEFYPNRSNLEN